MDGERRDTIYLCKSAYVRITNDKIILLVIPQRNWLCNTITITANTCFFINPFEKSESNLVPKRKYGPGIYYIIIKSRIMAFLNCQVDIRSDPQSKLSHDNRYLRNSQIQNNLQYFFNGEPKETQLYLSIVFRSSTLFLDGRKHMCRRVKRYIYLLEIL